MLVVWLLPWFWLSLFVLLLLYITPALAYVSLRNEKAEEDEKSRADCQSAAGYQPAPQND